MWTAVHIGDRHILSLKRAQIELRKSSQEQIRPLLFGHDVVDQRTKCDHVLFARDLGILQLPGHQLIDPGRVRCEIQDEPQLRHV